MVKICDDEHCFADGRAESTRQRSSESEFVSHTNPACHLGHWQGFQAAYRQHIHVQPSLLSLPSSRIQIPLIGQTNMALRALALFASLAAAQFPPKPEGVKTLRSKHHQGVKLSYKEPGLCETTPGVKSYAGRYFTTITKLLQI